MFQIGEWRVRIANLKTLNLLFNVRRSMKRRLVLTVAALTLSCQMAYMQTEVQPTNSMPNPYETISGWAKMPDGRTWGSTSAVEIDKDGRSIWVAERCGQNTCLD